MKVKSFSRVRLFSTPWTAAHQAPPSMGFSRQEYWSRVPSPSRGVNFWRVGLCVSEQVYFSPLEYFLFCFVLRYRPKIIVLAFVRDEFHCVLPPHLTRKEEAEGWSRQALSPWLTHLLSGPVCTWPPRNSKHTPNPFVTAHN